MAGNTHKANVATPPIRQALNGPTMGTRWSAIFFTHAGFDRAALQTDLQKAVDRVDAQMSPWKPDSELCRFNRLEQDQAIHLPPEMFAVMRDVIDLAGVSGGAFDPMMGSVVDAWGFGPSGKETDIRRTSEIAGNWRPGARGFAFDPYNSRLIRQADGDLDLCGIAKGYGVDRLSETLLAHGIANHLVAIDGELRAAGPGPSRNGWQIGIERPDLSGRSAQFIIEASNLGIATSGNYRHVRQSGESRVSHTMDPKTGTPVRNDLLSVTVLADTCAIADGLATTIMVMGRERGLQFARGLSLSVILAYEKNGQPTFEATGMLEGLLVAA